MLRMRVFVGVSLALLVTATTAQAGWGSHGSSGSWGSHGSSGGRVLFKSWGSHGSLGSRGSWGSRGSSGGLFARWHARAKWRASHGSWGSSGGSRGSRGSLGSRGSWGSHGSRGSSGSHGSWGSSGGSHGGVYYEKADKEGKAHKKEEKKDSGKKDAGKTKAKKASVSTGDVLIKVAVPDAAKIYVNDRITTSTGSLRQFVSRGLKKGLNYTFKIRAEIDRNGKTLKSHRQVTVKAGETVGVNFDFSRVETKLTLVVPQGAKVTLAGKSTATQGRIREYSTSRLTKGETWKDYVVEVSIKRGDRLISQQKTIDLQGGDDRTLQFKFDNDKVAVR